MQDLGFGFGGGFGCRFAFGLSRGRRVLGIFIGSRPALLAVLLVFFSVIFYTGLGPPIVGGVKARTFINHRYSVVYPTPGSETFGAHARTSLLKTLDQLKLKSATRTLIIVAGQSRPPW